MVRTRNFQICNKHTSSLIKCPFRGCLRFFQNILGCTQHINTQHRDPLPQDNSGPDEHENAPCSPSVDDPNADHYPNGSSPRTSPTLTQNKLTPLPAQPARLRESLDPIIEDFDQPHTPHISTSNNPASKDSFPIHSLLWSPFKSVSEDMVIDKDYSPNPFHFNSPQSNAGTEADSNADQGSMPHPHQAYPIEHDYAQDGQNTWPTAKTFHNVINSATSLILNLLLFTNIPLIHRLTMQ